MSRFHIILIGIFCVGVLLCGVGAGITFTEFSSLAYGGEHFVGETNMVTEDFDATIDLGQGQYTIRGYFGYEGMEEIGWDESVPENTVRYRVTYNADRIYPVLGSNEDRELYLYGEWLPDDEMKLFMETKDVALQDLKEGKISSYRTAGIEKVEVLVNPVNKEDVRLNYY